MEQPPVDNKRLSRPRTGRMIAGVCMGLGQYLSIDPTVVRLIFVLMLFSSGIGLVLYIILAIVMPEEGKLPTADLSDRASQAEQDIKAGVKRTAETWRQSSDQRRLLLAGVLIIIGITALAKAWWPGDWFQWQWIWPGLVILAGVYIIIKR